MHAQKSPSLTMAALAMFAAAALHVAALLAGPAMITALGAPESVVQSSQQGTMLAPLVILGIAAALAVLGFYALSGAGRLRPLPFVRPVLGAASGIFFLRALALPAVLLLTPAAPGQVPPFEFATSLLCLLIGFAFLPGLRRQAHTRTA